MFLKALSWPIGGVRPVLTRKLRKGQFQAVGSVSVCTIGKCGERTGATKQCVRTATDALRRSIVLFEVFAFGPLRWVFDISILLFES
jgi:hypothetical protein